MSPVVHVYCGPTIAAAEVLDILPEADVHPPVRHGDLLSLDAAAGDTVVIIDGVFHHAPATRHKEVLELLASGVRVVGAASMGALRAAELHPYGMTGVGAIFAAYRDGLIDADDEVAVAHTPGGQRQVSEALADIRAAAALAVRDGVIDQGEARAIIGHARSIHYTDRSWPALRAAAAADTGLAAALRRLASWHAGRDPAGGAKRADALDALRLVAAGGIPRAPEQAWGSQPWRTYHLRHWVARYRGCAVDGIHVPYLAVRQHQQLYDPDFPRRWRHHVLSWVAGTAGPAPAVTGTARIEGRALAAAEARGLATRHLSAGQLAYWLTSGEIAALADDEQLLRILVRSVPQDPAATVWPCTARDAPDLISPATDSARAAAAAFRRNDEIARSGPRRSVYDLRADRIRSDLAARWHADPKDEPGLAAAARDRGFHATAGAVEAARAFFLAAAPPD